MVLEVVSPGSVEKDTEVLRQAYARASIQEYWLVDARKDPVQFHVLHLNRGAYTSTRKRDGWVRSSVFGSGSAWCRAWERTAFPSGLSNRASRNPFDGRSSPLIHPEEPPMTERDLFLAARERQGPADRAAFLEHACAGDLALRERVEALLRSPQAAEDEAPMLAATPSDDPEPTTSTSVSGPDGVCGPLAGASGLLAAGPLGFLAPPAQPGSLGRLDHYEVLEVIGQGGMGVVLRAFDEKLHRVVAHQGAGPAVRGQRHRSSALRCARPGPPPRSATNTSSPFTMSRRHPVPYLVMEYVPGQTLQRTSRRGRPAQPGHEVLRIGMQTARAWPPPTPAGWSTATSSRAISCWRTARTAPSLTDFGLARAVDDASLDADRHDRRHAAVHVAGAGRGREVDHRSDLFSLGSVLYAACTGKSPFRAPNTMAVLARVVEDAPRPIHMINPSVPRWLEKVIARLMCKDPGRRYRSAAEAAEVLARHLSRLQEVGEGRSRLFRRGADGRRAARRAGQSAGRVPRPAARRRAGPVAPAIRSPWTTWPTWRARSTGRRERNCRPHCSELPTGETPCWPRQL